VHAGAVNDEVRRYIEEIPVARRPLFERLHALMLEMHPDAEMTLAYGMPAYRVGRRRLNLGVWQHGVSLYGWRRDNDGGFVARHPELAKGKGTIRISPAAAEGIADDEFRALLGGALEP
jgi:hypothetical protein